MVTRLEALLDALARLHGWHNPESVCYRLRNPLMIKSFAAAGRHEVDENGLRRFNSFLAGYKAATFDLMLKISGKSRAGLRPTDCLENLFRVYAIGEKAAHDNIVAFVRRALNDQSISVKTPLSFFQQQDQPTAQSLTE